MERRAVGHNFERDPPRDHPCQVWFNLVQGFQRRRFKCESLRHTTDRRRRMPSDGKSSPGQKTNSQYINVLWFVYKKYRENSFFLTSKTFIKGNFLHKKHIPPVLPPILFMKYSESKRVTTPNIIRSNCRS